MSIGHALRNAITLIALLLAIVCFDRRRRLAGRQSAAPGLRHRRAAVAPPFVGLDGLPIDRSHPTDANVVATQGADRGRPQRMVGVRHARASAGRASPSRRRPRPIRLRFARWKGRTAAYRRSESVRSGPARSNIGTNPGGLDASSWNRLRAGKLPPGRTLDLHGRTAQRAFTALHDFLADAHADRVRVVEIITGLGTGEAGGVLRRELPTWLNLPAHCGRWCWPRPTRTRAMPARCGSCCAGRADERPMSLNLIQRQAQAPA